MLNPDNNPAPKPDPQPRSTLSPSTDTVQIPGTLSLHHDGPNLETSDCLLLPPSPTLQDVATNWGYDKFNFMDLAATGWQALKSNNLALAEYCATGMLIHARTKIVSAETQALPSLAAAKLLFSIADSYLDFAKLDIKGAREHGVRILTNVSTLNCAEIQAASDLMHWVPTNALKILVAIHKTGAIDQSTADRLLKVAVEHLSYYNKDERALASLEAIKNIIKIQLQQHKDPQSNNPQKRDPQCSVDLLNAIILVEKIESLLNPNKSLSLSSSFSLIELATRFSNLGYLEGTQSLFEFLAQHEFSEDVQSNNSINAKASLARAEHELEIDNYQQAQGFAAGAAYIFRHLDINAEERKKAELIGEEAWFKGAAKLDTAQAHVLVCEYLKISCFRRAGVVLDNLLEKTRESDLKLDEMLTLNLKILSKALSNFNLANEKHEVTPRIWADLVRAVGSIDPRIANKISDTANFNKHIAFSVELFNSWIEISRAEARLMSCDYQSSLALIDDAIKNLKSIDSDSDRAYCFKYLNALKLQVNGFKNTDTEPGGLLERAYTAFLKIKEYEPCYLIAKELYELFSVADRKHRAAVLLCLALKSLPEKDIRRSYLVRLIEEVRSKPLDPKGPSSSNML